jgi:hypothetical protein
MAIYRGSISMREVALVDRWQRVVIRAGAELVRAVDFTDRKAINFERYERRFERGSPQRRARPWTKYAARGPVPTPYTKHHRLAALRLRIGLRGSVRSRMAAYLSQLFGGTVGPKGHLP